MRSESLVVLRMESVAERVADYPVGHHPGVPHASARRNGSPLPPAASYRLRNPKDAKADANAADSRQGGLEVCRLGDYLRRRPGTPTQ